MWKFIESEISEQISMYPTSMKVCLFLTPDWSEDPQAEGDERQLQKMCGDSIRRKRHPSLLFRYGSIDDNAIWEEKQQHIFPRV